MFNSKIREHMGQSSDLLGPGGQDLPVVNLFSPASSTRPVQIPSSKFKGSREHSNIFSLVLYRGSRSCKHLETSVCSQIFNSTLKIKTKNKKKKLLALCTNDRIPKSLFQVHNT